MATGQQLPSPEWLYLDDGIKTKQSSDPKGDRILYNKGGIYPSVPPTTHPAETSWRLSERPEPTSEGSEPDSERLQLNKRWRGLAVSP